MKPLDLAGPARIKIKLKGSSDPDDLDYGGVLNLLGLLPGRERPCSLHPDRTIDGDGCPRCWEIQRHRTKSDPA